MAHSWHKTYEQINITTQWSKGQNKITVSAKQQKIRAVKKQGFRNQFQLVFFTVCLAIVLVIVRAVL